MYVPWPISLALIALMSVVTGHQEAEARNLALLIGVSDYELPEIAKLKAPGNDVRLVYDTLRDRNFAREDITVLTDKLDEGEAPVQVSRPTQKAILDALDALATKAGSGDLVVIYYSGHGSYVRQDRMPDEIFEPSGFNQVLLAIDAKKRDDIAGEIKGAITDKVLRTKFDAVLKKSFLWLILDACHSGGFTRDESVGATVHFVDPHVLDPRAGSLAAIASPFENPPNPWVGRDVGGRQVAFLAAPETHPAYEKETGDTGKSYSLFTLTLVTTLRAENFSSYRLFARAIRRAQSGAPGEVPTPVFEGDLDNPMFDGALDGPRIWPAEFDVSTGEVHVAAGALHGIQLGSVLAFERGGLQLGLGKVISVGLTLSTARPIAVDDRLDVTRTNLVGKFAAKVARPAVPFRLKVALPLDPTGENSGRTAHAVIESLSREPVTELPVEWLKARDRDADLYLRVIGDMIYLVPPTGELVTNGRSRTPAVSTEGGAAATVKLLKENLLLLLRQQNLRRIAGEMRDTGLAEKIEVNLSRVRNMDELSRLQVNEKQKCASWDSPANDADRSPISMGVGRDILLTHCDLIFVEITNHWPKDIDVTLLYFDAEGGIGQLPVGGEVRIPANQAHFPHRFPPIKILTWCDAKVWKVCEAAGGREFMPVGTEHLMVIIAEVDKDQQDRRTFEYLAQPPLVRAKELTNNARNEADSFDELLRSAGLIRPQIRGEIDRTGDATIKLITWTVRPPGQMDLRPRGNRAPLAQRR
jgi:hypothetical protein